MSHVTRVGEHVRCENECKDGSEGWWQKKQGTPVEAGGEELAQAFMNKRKPEAEKTSLKKMERIRLVALPLSQLSAFRHPASTARGRMESTSQSFSASRAWCSMDAFATWKKHSLVTTACLDCGIRSLMDAETPLAA